MNIHFSTDDRLLYTKAVKLALPITAQSLISVSIQLADTLMLSHFGEVPMSGASLAGQYAALFQVCAMGLGMGTAVLTTRFWGMRDLRSLRQTVTLLFWSELLVGTVFALFGVGIPNLVLRIFTENPELIDYGAVYLRLLLPVYFMTALSQGCNAVLRSVGHLWIPFWGSVCAFFVNFLLNWMLIFGHLGAPALGVAGAALATDIARGVELIVICGYFFFRENNIGYSVRALRTDCHGQLRQYVKFCIPVLISDGLLGMGNTAVAVIMGRMGASFVAANAVTVVVQQLSTVLHHGAAGAGSIVIGHTLGEGNTKKAQKQGYGFTWIGVLIGMVAITAIVLCRKRLIAVYGVSDEAKQIAWQLMNGIMVTMVPRCISGVLTKGVLRGGGDTRFVMVIDVLFLWLVSIPFGACAALVFHWPAFWIYVALQTDQIIKCGLCLWRLHSKLWIKQINGCQ